MPSDGPAMPQADPNKHDTGDRAAGQDVYRMETFGDESFWTEAARLPAGMLAAKFTPVDALKAGYQINIDAIDNANAVIGVVAKDSNGDGRIDIMAGDKVGVSCAFCHSITDDSVFSMPRGGSIGKHIDGPTPHFLNVGATLAVAANTRAFYPVAQLALTANGGKTIGRAPKGLTETSTASSTTR